MILVDHDGRDEPPRGIMIRLLVVASNLTACRDDIFTSMAAWQLVAKIVMMRVTRGSLSKNAIMVNMNCLSPGV